MENPLAGEENGDFREDIDALNDETFGDGATEGDWESSHYIMTGETEGLPPQLPVGGKQQPSSERELGLGASPHLNFGLGAIGDEVLSDVAKMKIKELWPSSPQPSPYGSSIWSSPELPARVEPVKHMSPQLPAPPPPGAKIMSLEELERELTSQTPPPDSTPSSSSMSPAPQPHPSPVAAISPNASPAPPPGHQYPRPPPGLIQHPPPGLPRPLPPGGMPPPRGVIPWPPHMQGIMGGRPQYALPRIPPPNIPIRGVMNVTASGQRFPPPPVPFLPHGRPAHIPPGHHTPFQQGHAPFGAGNHPSQYPAMVPTPVPRKSKRSEYLDEMQADGSGFMTQKEKDWVIKIQLVQLQCQDPDNEDYYYQNYQKRKALKLLQPSTTSSPSSSPTTTATTSHPSSSPSRDSSQAPPSPTPSTQSQTRPLPEFTHRTYKPKEFEGTLGKLHVSSIAAPRKTIDIPLAVNIESSGGKEGGGGGLDAYRKKKQALIVIEKVFEYVLALEALEKKEMGVMEGEELQEVLKGRDEMTRKAFALLRLGTQHQDSDKKDDTVLLLMCNHRKGKRALKRLLPFLDHDQARAVSQALLRHLPAIIKKDSADQVLPELSRPVQAALSSMSLATLSDCLSLLLETGLSQSANHPGSSTPSSSSSSSAIVRVCASTFGATLLLEMVECGRKVGGERGEEEDGDDHLRERWQSLVRQLHSKIQSHQSRLAAKSSPATKKLLQSLPSFL